MKKIISVVLAAVFTLTVFSCALPGLTLKAGAAIDFKCGEKASWYLDTQTGLLTISGTGNTYDYNGLWSQPFGEFFRYITAVVVEEGITGLGDYFLDGLSNCGSVSLPSTLEYIGNNPFSNNMSVITIPENSSLKYFKEYFSIGNTKWFKTQPDGAVYLGNCVVGYKGEISGDEPVVLDENTVSIAPCAFYNMSNLDDIVFPDSLEFIGYRALDNTGFIAKQPVGALYIGKVLCKYIGNVTLDDYEFVIKEGTVSVSSEAFYGKKIIKSVHFPASVNNIGYNAFWNSSVTAITFAENSGLKYIGNSAFGICRLEVPNLPEGLEYIGDMAFNNYSPSLLKIPASVKKIGRLYGTGSTNTDLRTRFEVSPDNEYYCSDEYGVLYNKDKSVLIRASTQPGLTDFTVPETVKEIAPGAFRYLTYSYSAVRLPDGLRKIGQEAFACMAYDNTSTQRVIDFGYSEPEIGSDIFYNDRYLSSVIVRSASLTFPESAFSSVIREDFKVYLMFGSAMHNYCETFGINYEFLDYVLQLDGINSLLAAAQNLDRALYTSESLELLDEAVSAVNLNTANLTQEQVDEWASAINAALTALKYLPADFALINEALSRTNSLNRALYTADSLLLLDQLVLSINYNSDISQQAAVNKLAADINSAVDLLVYRDADYSAVNYAVSKALAVDKTQYTEQSFSNLESALNNVEYGLDITSQNKVNAFAQAIEFAVSALVEKPADYSDVEKAIQRAGLLNREWFTADSLAAVDLAIASVDYSLTYSNRQTVAQYAFAINNAVDSLVYLPADYSSVDEAIARTQSLDTSLWSEASLIILSQCINSVDRTLNITQQSVVNACAREINAKIDELEYAAVNLRNETHGVIVSATAKEINPATVLSVEKLDPSDISSANFAVGGKVKTALYFDISLIFNGAKTQPDGTVTVKIRIPNGVSPDKCKVYHVTDDPVNPLVKFIGSIDGNYIVFQTEHFSEFAVIEIETVPEGIVITSPPSKTVYNKGEAIDTSGMIVTAFYSNGTNAAVADYDISADTNATGIRPLTVYYTFNGVTKSAATVITVKDTASDNNYGAETVLRAPSNTTVEYRSVVTLTAVAENMPQGCSLVLYSGDDELERSTNGKIEYEVGQITGSKTFTVKVVDYSGKVLAYKNGSPVEKSFRIEVQGGFFARIIAAFKALFRLLPTVKL